VLSSVAGHSPPHDEQCCLKRSFVRARLEPLKSASSTETRRAGSRRALSRNNYHHDFELTGARQT
jgi:hypothetical protein